MTTHKDLDTYLGALRAAFGDSLTSVVLYGSRAGAGPVSVRDADFNLLIVVSSLDAAETGVSVRGVRGSSAARSLARATRRWTTLGNPAPFVFTAERLRTSADVFPIEFTDIIARHTVLHGTDPFTALTVHDDNLRHQCEYELRGILLRLYRAQLTHAGDARRLADALAASITPVLTIFRHLLRLVKPVAHAPGSTTTPAPVTRTAALHELATIFGLDESIFLAALGIKDKRPAGGDATTGRRPEPVTLMHAYIAQLEHAVDRVDAL